MANKNFMTFVKKRNEEELRLVQVKVPESLYDQVNKARIDDGIKWVDIIEAAFKIYLLDRNRK